MEGTVVVIAAHAFEARAAAGVGRGMVKEPWGSWMLYRGEMWDIPLAVIRSGPGKVAAAAATQAAIQYLDPAVIVSFGVAGSPDSSTVPGTMVIARTVVDVALEELGDLPVEIPSKFESPTEFRNAFLGVPGSTEGLVLCWEGQVASPSRRPPTEGLRGGPVAVDWESAAVAQVAQMWDIPWAVFKVVSDHGEADRLRRVAVVARRPLQWAAEVFRRACAAYLGEDFGGTESQDEKVTRREDQGEDRETSAG
ncbi:MAG: hypothetical protein ABFS37_03925 [Acidobacteriota bacterium]